MNMGKKGEVLLTIIVIILIILSLVNIGYFIFTPKMDFGHGYNIKTINDKIKNEIPKLFTEESQKIVVYLPAEGVRIRQGETYGVVFAVKNIEPEQKTLSYDVTVAEMAGCPADTDPLEWITYGKSGSFDVQPGDIALGLTKLQPLSDSPSCVARFMISVEESGKEYTNTTFDVQIREK